MCLPQFRQGVWGKLYVLFADLKAAFDSVNMAKLINTLRKVMISRHLVNRLDNLYEETPVEIRKKTAVYKINLVDEGC